MSVIRWLFKPRPMPAFVLLAIILTFLGVGISKQVPVVGAVSIVTALVLLLNFIRGLKQDLEVDRVGVVATARITRVEKKGGTYRGHPYDVWQVHYTYLDREGVEHADVMPIDAAEEARKYHAGGTAQLRYHPDNPDIFRWLG
jgi:hypothetical protein